MEEQFLRDRFSKKGVEVIVPQSRHEIIELHRIIQKELTFGRVAMNSKQFVINSIQTMLDAGAEGVVLGCTEFSLMIKADDLPSPLFNTTEIHAQAAYNYILSYE